MRVLVALGAAAAALFLSIDPAHASTGAITIPFTFVDNRMMIICKINGAGPFSVIVDTGSPDIAIDTKVAKQLGLQVREVGTGTGAGNKPVEFGSTKLRTLAIGSLSFSDEPATVIDLSEIRTKLRFARLDGVIGYSVLKLFRVYVNVDSGTISFLSSRPPVPSSASTTPFTGVTPIVAATIDGIPTQVIVDTGDRSSLTLFGPFARKHAFYGKYPSRSNIVTGYGIGGPVYGDVFTIPSLETLGRRLSAVVTRASRQVGGVFTSTGQGGSLGEGVLKRFNIVYDYHRNQMIAWPSKYFAVRDRFSPPPGT